MKIRLLELCAGYGSQALALKNLGIEVYSEIAEFDKYASQAYMQLHGETKNYGDIYTIDESKLPYFDMITYSTPCQDFSSAGKQAGGDKGSGTRSSLLWECERIIRAVKPKFLLMENVKNLLSKKHCHNFNEWFKVLEDMGYTNYYKVLNAKDYGIPQNRERIFCVSILGGGQYLFPNPKPLEKRLKDMLEPCVDEKYYLSADKVEKFANALNKKIENQDVSYCIDANYWKGTIPQQFLNKNRRQLVKDVSNTIRCGGGGSLDGKHTWDIVVEPFIADDTQGFDGVRYYDNYSLTLRSERSGLKVVEPKVIQVGNIVSTGNWDNPQRGRIDSPSGCSPALNTCQGGGLEPKILEEGCKNAKNKTIRTLLRILWKEIREKKVWEQIGRFQCVSETEILRQGMYEKSFFKTRETTSNIFQRSYNSEKYKFIIIESNFLRDMWLSIKSRRSSQRWGLSEQQFREFTSFMQKLSFKTAQKKEKMCYLWETDESFRVLRETLSEIQEIWKSVNIKSQNKYRIRKLTARECWRLMGVKDEQFDRLHGISNSQLYKLAGNSIVVDVLEAIFKNLLMPETTDTKGQLSLF